MNIKQTMTLYAVDYVACDSFGNVTTWFTSPDAAIDEAKKVDTATVYRVNIPTNRGCFIYWLNRLQGVNGLSGKVIWGGAA